MAEKTTIQSVSRACMILQLLGIHKGGMSTTEIGQYLNLNRSTTHHLLATLHGHDFLSLTLNGKYTLGPAIGELASGSAEMVVRNIVHGILLDLVNEIGETTYLAIFDRGVTLIDTVLGTGALRVVQAYPAYNEPPFLHARASGKLYLASLPEHELRQYLSAHPLDRLTDRTIADGKALAAELVQIKQNGFATDLEEFSVGIHCTAYPLSVDNKTIGCVSVSYPSARKDKQQAIQAALDQACPRISKLFVQNGYELLLTK